MNGEDVSASLHQMMEESIKASVAAFLAGDVAEDWDFAALRRHYLGWLCVESDFHYTTEQLNDLKREDVENLLLERGKKILAIKEQRYGAPIMREVERICLLRNVDLKWMDHIDNMDQLRQGIALRSYGQKDPVVEYRIEGFEMFDAMVESIRAVSYTHLDVYKRQVLLAAGRLQNVAEAPLIRQGMHHVQIVADAQEHQALNGVVHTAQHLSLIHI